MKKLLIITGLFLIIPFSFCGDLDDGIGTADGISTGNDLQKDINVKFIMRKSKAAAQNNVNNGDTVVVDDGSSGSSGGSASDGTNIGGVNMVGGRAKNITIIQQIKGDVTTIGGK